MKPVYTLFLLFILSSCGVSLEYLGGSYSQTSHVDVYVDANAIKKPYTVIGKVYEGRTGRQFYSLETLQKKVVQKAREQGADAVLFVDYYLSQPATVINTGSHTRIDTITRSTTTVGTTTVEPVITGGRQILFPKYN